MITHLLFVAKNFEIILILNYEIQNFKIKSDKSYNFFLYSYRSSPDLTIIRLATRKLFQAVTLKALGLVQGSGPDLKWHYNQTRHHPTTLENFRMAGINSMVHMQVFRFLVQCTQANSRK